MGCVCFLSTESVLVLYLILIVHRAILFFTLHCARNIDLWKERVYHTVMVIVIFINSVVCLSRPNSGIVELLVSVFRFTCLFHFIINRIHLVVDSVLVLLY